VGIAGSAPDGGGVIGPARGLGPGDPVERGIGPTDPPALLLRFRWLAGISGLCNPGGP
jgi:hypothetical protein